MNKQKLTKTLSFSKWLLFFFLAVGITLSSCGKDYDDDINDLQAQIKNNEGVKGLQTQITDLQTALNDAKAQAADAKKTAEEAKDAAGVSAAEAKEAAIAKAEADLKAVNDNLQSQINAITAGTVTDEQIAEIVAKITPDLNKVAADIIKIVGHRVTSLVRIPNQTLNDEPAIIFRTLSYVPQVFNPLMTPYTVDGVDSQGNGEVTLDIAGASRLYIDNRSTLVKYQVNPSVSVKAADIESPYFMGDIQENANLRTVKPEMAGKDMPIKVASWELDETTGVLSVKVTKNVPANENINFEGQGNSGFNAQKYYIASLRTIIPTADRTEEEKTKGVIPEVASEYSRIAEVTVVPMIKQVGSEAHPAHVTNPVDRMELLNGKDVTGKYVHYHDSASLYLSNDAQLIDHRVDWNEKVDLLKYVTVCDFENLYIKPDGTVDATVGSHLDIENYKEYGLEFRFSIPSTPYMLGTLGTNQQQFATIAGNIMSSKVYTISGETPTAAGREPIVRIQLIDTRNNNALVAQRYMKFLWTDEPIVKDIAVDFPQDTVTCKMFDNTIFTQKMNEDFYRKVSDARPGMSKEQFHATYKKTEMLSLTKDGVEILTNPPLTWTTLDDTSNGGNGITVPQANAYAKNAIDEQQNEDVIFAMAKDGTNNAAQTYNLKWYMSPKAVGTIKDFKESVYVLKVKFTDPAGNNALEVQFTQKIIVPQQVLRYTGTNWQAGSLGTVYKVNPIVYEQDKYYQNVAPNPAVSAGIWNTWNTGKDNYNHIKADLMEGYSQTFYTENYAVNNLSQFIKYIRSCAKVRFEFDDTKFANYSHLANYTVTNDRQALWSNSQTPLAPSELKTYSHPGVKDDGRYDRLAATLDNNFGSTALSNQVTANNMPWYYNETLGSGVDEAYSWIHLSEINPSDGSSAANNLIGKKVPMQLVVEYNEYNKVPIQNFETFIYDPLSVRELIPGYFQDGVVNGSYIDVQSGLAYTDWNGYMVSRAAPVTGAVHKELFTQQLWDFYQVRDVIFDTDINSVRTNLKLNDDQTGYLPVEGVRDGRLPNKTDIKQVISYNVIDGSGATYTDKNPAFLRFFNNSGTPVSIAYKIYMDVVVGYKWGKKVSNVEFTVQPSDYNPNNN